MIKITLRKYGYTIKGHAGYAERGQDIVCASVSTLGLTFAKAFKQVPQTKITQKDGYLDVRVPHPERNMIRSYILMQTFRDAIKEIAKQYPEYIELKGVLKDG